MAWFRLLYVLFVPIFGLIWVHFAAVSGSRTALIIAGHIATNSGILIAPEVDVRPYAEMPLPFPTDLPRAPSSASVWGLIGLGGFGGVACDDPASVVALKELIEEENKNLLVRAVVAGLLDIDHYRLRDFIEVRRGDRETLCEVTRINPVPPGSRPEVQAQADMTGTGSQTIEFRIRTTTSGKRVVDYRTK